MTENIPFMPGGGRYGRSALAEVRNPVLGLPATQEIIDQTPVETRRLLGKLLRQLAFECTVKSNQCWGNGKAMMAAYYRVNAVYAKHIAHAIDRRARP